MEAIRTALDQFGTEKKLLSRSRALLENEKRAWELDKSMGPTSPGRSTPGGGLLRSPSPLYHPGISPSHELSCVAHVCVHARLCIQSAGCSAMPVCSLHGWALSLSTTQVSPLNDK